MNAASSDGPALRRSILLPSKARTQRSSYRIAQHALLEGSISFADMAASCGLTEEDTRHINILGAISVRIFEEKPEAVEI